MSDSVVSDFPHSGAHNKFFPRTRNKLNQPAIPHTLNKKSSEDGN